MNQKLRQGFTFIELLFVIVVMGIVGGIALEAIRQYYEGIYRTQTYTQRVNEADHILEQLSKYFENAVDLSIVNLDQDEDDGNLDGGECADPGIEAESGAHDYTVAFVGVDTDSLHTLGKPGWSEMVQSGFNGISLTSNDANFTAANEVIGVIHSGFNLANSAIYNYEGVVGSCSDFRWDGSAGKHAYYTITNVDFLLNTLTTINNAGTSSPKNDRKYLLATGYAFRVLDTGEFRMYTNFRPWKNEIYTNGTASTLGENVASFYADFNNTNSFSDRGSVWRLKVCMRGLDSSLSNSDEALQSICRERKVHVRY